MNRVIKVLGLLISLGMLTACAENIEHHGFNFEHSKFDTIKVGETHKSQVLADLGSPTSESDFGQKKFYYIARTVERRAFLEPQVLEQRVWAIGFNQSDVVSDITELKLDDAKNVVFSENKTEIHGNTLTPMQQIMTNIGKFNKKK